MEIQVALALFRPFTKAFALANAIALATHPISPPNDCHCLHPAPGSAAYSTLTLALTLALKLTFVPALTLLPRTSPMPSLLPST